MTNIFRKLFPFITTDLYVCKHQPIIDSEAIWINKYAIRLHQTKLNSKSDNEALTGTDSFHQDYINFYEQAIELIKYGTGITAAYAIFKYRIDADNHLYYYNHPELCDSQTGSREWQSLWYWRWMAIIKLLEASP